MPHGDFPRLNDHCKEEPAVRGRRRRRTTVITPEVSFAGLNTFHILPLVAKDYAADSAQIDVDFPQPNGGFINET